MVATDEACRKGKVGAKDGLLSGIRDFAATVVVGRERDKQRQAHCLCMDEVEVWLREEEERKASWWYEVRVAYTGPMRHVLPSLFSTPEHKPFQDCSSYCHPAAIAAWRPSRHST